MKILLVSNEYPRFGKAGNPIIGRLKNALESDKRVNNVKFCPFMNKLSDFRRIRKKSKDADIIHIQFGGLYAFLVWGSLIGVSKPKLLTFHGTDIHAKAKKDNEVIFDKVEDLAKSKDLFLIYLVV